MAVQYSAQLQHNLRLAGESFMFTAKRICLNSKLATAEPWNIYFIECLQIDDRTMVYLQMRGGDDCKWLYIRFWQ